MSDHIKTDLAECLRIEAALTTDPHTRTRLQAYIAEAEKLTHPQPVTPAGGEVGGWNEALGAVGRALPGTESVEEVAQVIADLERLGREEGWLCASLGANIIKQSHPPVADAALANAYDVGWIECTNWAKRDDLVSDMDSPAYAADRARNLAALNQRGGG